MPRPPKYSDECYLAAMVLREHGASWPEVVGAIRSAFGSSPDTRTLRRVIWEVEKEFEPSDHDGTMPFLWWASPEFKRAIVEVIEP